jgi:hypothetical protein
MNEFTPSEPESLEGRVVRVCSVCGEAKPKEKFFKDKVGEFDGGDGWSKDCRACRLKEAKIKHDIWKAERGIK